MHETHTIHEIDGLYCPCSIAPDDPDVAPEPGRVTYWGTGYETEAAARECLRLAEYGEVNPPGIPVSFETGERRI